jgi:membrane-associated protease RseP (regulator of RpoE activity)
MWWFAAFLFLASFTSLAMYALGTWGAARWFGIPVLKVQLGRLVVWRRRGLELGLLPFGSSVSMADTRNEDSPPDIENPYDRQPRLVRAFIHLAGPLAIFVLGVLLIGDRAIGSLERAFAQIVAGTLAPDSVGVEHITRLHERFEQAGWMTALGIVSVKTAAFNLLPLPLIGGGAALIELLGPAPAREEKWRERLNAAGIVALLLVMACWCWAIGATLWRMFNDQST